MNLSDVKTFTTCRYDHSSLMNFSVGYSEGSSKKLRKISIKSDFITCLNIFPDKATPYYLYLYWNRQWIINKETIKFTNIGVITAKVSIRNRLLRTPYHNQQILQYLSGIKYVLSSIMNWKINNKGKCKC